MTKQPTYRFAGYTAPWVEKKLGEVSESFEYGLNASAKEFDGVNKYIRITDIDDFSNEFLKTNLTSPDVKIDESSDYLLSEGDILFARTGASTGKTYYYKKTDGVVFFAGFLIRARIKEDNDHIFIFQNTLTKDFKKYVDITSQRSGQPGVNAKEYANFLFSLPSLPEQTAIGSFFQDIDQLISLQQRKLEVLKEQKKTYLKLLFPAKGQTKPALRFAGFEDDWKEVKLGEVLTERNIQMVPSDQVPLVSFTVENGVTPKTERYNREFLVREESKKYKYTRYNDIVYNPANLKFGAIARNKYGEAVFSPIYVTFEANYSNILPEFIEGILTSKDFIQQALKFQEGTVYERMAVKADDFRRLAITVPSLLEQEAIGSFFQDLDKAIAKQEEKVNQLKESKQTLLRKMFI